MKQPEARLGYATTRELLEEIAARGRCEDRYREEGDALAIGAANLLNTLPGSMLSYRTVGEESPTEPPPGWTAWVTKHLDS